MPWSTFILLSLQLSDSSGSEDESDSYHPPKRKTAAVAKAVRKKGKTQRSTGSKKSKAPKSKKNDGYIL